MSTSENTVKMELYAVSFSEDKKSTMRWIQHSELTRKFTISEITEVLAQRLVNAWGLSSVLMALPFGRAVTEYLGMFPP